MPQSPIVSEIREARAYAWDSACKENNSRQDSTMSEISALVVTEIRKSYGGANGVNALSGVSMTIRGDGVVGLFGRSGSGKSTLLRCINRLVVPDSGRVVFGGTDITALSGPPLRRVRQKIGMVFQEFNLVNRLTVLNNVLTGRAGSTSAWRCWFKAFPKEDVEFAESLLARVGLSDLRYKRADELSGGQRQRVGIARALMQEPALILADEPTASLDPATGEEIMQLICEIGATSRIPVIVSIHDVSLAQRYVNSVVALNAGVKIFDGPPGDVDLDAIYREPQAGNGYAGSADNNQPSPSSM